VEADETAMLLDDVVDTLEVLRAGNWLSTSPILAHQVTVDPHTLQNRNSEGTSARQLMHRGGMGASLPLEAAVISRRSGKGPNRSRTDEHQAQAHTRRGRADWDSEPRTQNQGHGAVMES
jgi:hypothetical protein